MECLAGVACFPESSVGDKQVWVKANEKGKKDFKVLALQIADVWIRTDGIVLICYRPNSPVTEEEAEEVRVFIQDLPHQNLIVVHDFSRMKSLGDIPLMILTGRQKDFREPKQVIWVSSGYQRIKWRLRLIRLGLWDVKRIFTSEEKAIQWWLKQRK